MENITTNLVEHFSILFEKLEEAKNEQEIVLQTDTKELSETYNIITLFKEYQESIIESNYSTFTIS